MDRKVKKILKLLAILVSIFVVSSSNTKIKKQQTKKDFTVPYETFQTYVGEGKVEEVNIVFSDDEFEFVMEDECYYTDNPRYDDFKKDMLEAGVKVNEMNVIDVLSIISTVLRVGFILYIVKFLIKNLGGMDDIENRMEKRPDITFKDVAGLKEVKEDLLQVTDFLANPKKYEKAGAKLPKGVLLYGPPGTGKTLLARAVAGEANANFISVVGSDFSNKYVGVGGDRVRKLFNEARKEKPCIIFIDEIDAVGGKRNDHLDSENRNTLNALLAEMDGFSSGEGVLVIAATNKLEDLDDALIRPGRFDNIFAVPLPTTTEERQEIINIYKKGKKFDETVDFNLFAKQTMGNSPADIEAVLNEASIIAANSHKGIISKKDLDDAYLKKVLKGHVKSNAERDTEQLKLVSWHEAGHALVGVLTGQEVAKVTILPSSSGAGGFTIFSPSKLGLFTKEELENQIRSLYAGRAAEELFVGKNKITTGASNDIERATDIIHMLVSKYGMCDGECAVLDYSRISGSKEFVMSKMNELSSMYYQQTLELLRANEDRLRNLADKLFENETLSEKEILEIVKSE